MQTPTTTISELNELIRDWIDACPPMQDVWVSGEIKNFRRFASGGHVYFTLSDATSTLQCVAFDLAASRLTLPFHDGMHVLARGKVRYFNRKGTIQFQITYMVPQGSGDLARNLAVLKEVLAKDGLFDHSRKRPLPPFPHRVAVITASDSAAQADVIRLVDQYAPSIQLTLIPATMQGLGCVPSIINALDWINPIDSIDLVLITRGGGSAEDLLPFNDEQLVRKMAASHQPIAVAIGHETDETFADLVADMSYPTPSAAAIGICQPLYRLPERIQALTEGLACQLISKHADIVTDHGALVTQLNDKLGLKIDQINQRFERQLRELDLLSPLRKLQQGFSISRLKNKGIVTTISDISINDTLVTQIQNGWVTSTITDINSL